MNKLRELTAVGILLSGCISPIKESERLLPKLYSDRAHFVGFSASVPDVAIATVGWTVADYQQKNERVRIDRDAAKCSLRSCKLDRHPLDRVLAHEVGHALVDQYSKSLGHGEWPPDAQNNEEIVIYSMLAEGTAEWISNLGRPPEGYFRSGYPQDLTDVMGKERRPIITYTGYQLVAPILDAHGLDGFRYIIENPPQGFSELSDYSSIALDRLTAQSHRTTRSRR